MCFLSKPGCNGRQSSSEKSSKIREMFGRLGVDDLYYLTLEEVVEGLHIIVSCILLGMT